MPTRKDTSRALRQAQCGLSRAPQPRRMPTSPSDERNQTRSAGSITLADVARIAGVAKITASRVLSNPSVVSEETRRRVLDAVASSGYIPNIMAGALKSKRTRLIACLVPTIASGSAFLVAVQAMTEAFRTAGFQVMLAERGYDPSREAELIEAVIARRPDAVVITGVMSSEPVRRRLKAAGMPVVETWDMSARPIDMLVGFSHEEAGAAMARFLHRKGRRRLAMIAATEPRGDARARGFIDEARRLGLATEGEPGMPVHTIEAPTRMSHGREGLAALLARHPRIDALFCATDLVAVGALIEAQHRRIDVPGQLAICGFGDLDMAAATEPPLTTIHIDSGEIGRRAAALAMARIDGKRVPRRVVDVGFAVVERGSA